MSSLVWQVFLFAKLHRGDKCATMCHNKIFFYKVCISILSRSQNFGTIFQFSLTILSNVKKWCGDREKLLKLSAKGQEFAKFLRSLEQFVRPVKGQNNVW